MGEIFNVLDAAMMSERAIKTEYSVNLYPSEGSAQVNGVTYGKCLRASYLRYTGGSKMEIKLPNGQMGIPKSVKPGPKAQWIFEFGNQAEDSIIKAAVKAKIFVQGQVKFSIPVSGLKLNGALDGVFLDANNEYVGIEVKSINGNFAESQVIGTPGMRSRGMKGEPKADHVMQTAVYAWHFREQIPRFKILYIMRDKCFREEFELVVRKDQEGRRIIYIDGGRWQQFTLDDVYDRYKKLAFNINAGILPPRDYTLLYDDDTMNQLLKDKKLAKGDTEKWTKYRDREAAHVQWKKDTASQSDGIEVDPGKEPRRLKRPIKGDWRCSYCDFKTLCYSKSSKPLGE